MCDSSPTKVSKPTYFLNDKDINSVKDLCIKNVPFWDNFTHNDLQVKLLPNAFTHIVYRITLICENRNKFPYHTVVLKKRSNYNNIIHDIEHQSEVSKILGDNNCGPRLIGRFSDFIIQEFIEGNVMKTTSFHNLSVVASLASSLAKFHKKGTEISHIEWDRTPLVIRQISKWSEHVDRIIKKHNLDFDFNELISSFETYKNLIESHIKTSNSIANSVLFCHNDLYIHNILNINQGLYLIDFDFSGFNYVGWELSNFFSKICLHYDSNIFPYFRYDESLELSYEFKSIFVAVYLSQLLFKNVLPSDNVVKEFLDSLEVHYLGVELFWTFWGIIMSERSPNESAVPFHSFSRTQFHHNLFKTHLRKYKQI